VPIRYFACEIDSLSANKEDARKVDHKTLEEMWLRAVKRIQDGESPEIIARVLGVDRSTVYGSLARYRCDGCNGLKEKPLRPPSWTARSRGGFTTR